MWICRYKISRLFFPREKFSIQFIVEGTEGHGFVSRNDFVEHCCKIRVVDLVDDTIGTDDPNVVVTVNIKCVLYDESIFTYHSQIRSLVYSYVFRTNGLIIGIAVDVVREDDCDCRDTVNWALAFACTLEMTFSCTTALLLWHRVKCFLGVLKCQLDTVYYVMMHLPGIRIIRQGL